MGWFFLACEESQDLVFFSCPFSIISFPLPPSAAYQNPDKQKTEIFIFLVFLIILHSPLRASHAVHGLCTED